jgi:hypothetical protein
MEGQSLSFHHTSQHLQVVSIGCSFQPMAYGCESDVRFIYCACCISYMLNDWSGIDQDKAVEYIRMSQVLLKRQDDKNVLSDYECTALGL